MPDQPTNYFRYFSDHPDIERWGVGLSGAGLAVVAPGASYPPAGHPADHAFVWERGRVLDRLQIVLISAGAGTLETKDTGLIPLTAGSGFLMRPNVWHRYRPESNTGWIESWVELYGPVADKLLDTSVFGESNCVCHDVLSSGLDAALDAIHNKARTAAPGFDPEFSVLGLSALSAWARCSQVKPTQSRMARAITTAERYFEEHHTEAINVEELARKLGVAYSHFRREFKVRTGYSPWQYVIHLRLSRAKRLLASGDATLDDIANRLGFSSAFHLSTVFKQSYGLSPNQFRGQLRANYYSPERVTVS